jgi:polyphosphate kinase 2 (PPK2 family)
MSKQPPAEFRPKMTAKEYEKELRKLQTELCRLQDWVVHAGLRVVVIFEGRDAAGKGGMIKAIMERVNPRVFRLVALPAPSDRERTQIYVQRYLQHFPAAGEVLIFDGISHLLSLIRYEEAPREKVKLPKRSHKGEYDDQATLEERNFVPEKH